MSIKRSILAGALIASLASTAALAAFFVWPQVGGTNGAAALTGAETVPMDTNLTGGAMPQTEIASLNQIASFTKGSASGLALSPKNALGNGAQNFWQRGTTASASITTTCIYRADEWCGISGTSTIYTVTRDTSVPTSGAGIPGFQYSAKFARTASQTGVVKAKYVHILETADSVPLQGQLVAFSFYTIAGANFSSTLNQISPLVAIGTGTDESVANFASGAWTGYAVAAGTCDGTAANLQNATTSWARYTCYATIPVTATQIGVAVQSTPVGTAGANDWLKITGLQLEVVGATNQPASGFEYKNQAVELAQLQRRFYQITETATITPRAVCHVTTANSVMQCAIPFPVTMRVAPTAAYTAGFAGFTTTAETTATACSALAIDDTVVFLNSTALGLAKCTLTSSTIAVGLSMTLVDNSGSGVMAYSADY